MLAIATGACWSCVTSKEGTDPWSGALNSSTLRLVQETSDSGLFVPSSDNSKHIGSLVIQTCQPIFAQTRDMVTINAWDSNVMREIGSLRRIYGKYTVVYENIRTLRLIPCVSIEILGGNKTQMRETHAQCVKLTRNAWELAGLVIAAISNTRPVPGWATQPTLPEVGVAIRRNMVTPTLLIQFSLLFSNYSLCSSNAIILKIIPE